MIDLVKGRYRARLARSPLDIESLQALRGLAFDRPSHVDQDRFDPLCAHLLIEPLDGSHPVGGFRFIVMDTAQQVQDSYSAQFYDLTALMAFKGPVVELGRFCVHPDRSDPDILRLAWGAMTRIVDSRDIKLLFGCCSFAGTDPGAYKNALALLARRHLAPAQWAPECRSGETVDLRDLCKPEVIGPASLQQMPPLLRTYLSMGGWVSDHAVVDREMDTLHVFTGVEIGSIPEARKKLLRAVSDMR